MDVDLGGSARIPLTAFDADRLAYTPAEVTVYVRQPDSSTLGPLSVTQADLDRRAFLFTTTLAGQHRFRVVEALTGTSVTEGGFYVWASYADSTTLWAPTLADVAGLVPTRTIDDAGIQQNTFTATTVPTDTQVSAYIADIVAEVAGQAGDVPAGLAGQARHTVKLGVAWLVERSFPPTSAVENVANDFVNDYRASLRGLVAAVDGYELLATGRRAVSVSMGSFTWPEV